MKKFLIQWVSSVVVGLLIGEILFRLGFRLEFTPCCCVDPMILVLVR